MTSPVAAEGPDLLERVGDLAAGAAAAIDGAVSAAADGAIESTATGGAAAGAAAATRRSGLLGPLEGDGQALADSADVVLDSFSMGDRHPRQRFSHFDDRLDLDGRDERARGGRSRELLVESEAGQIDDEQVGTRLVGRVEQRGVGREHQARAVGVLAEGGLRHVRARGRRHRRGGACGRSGGGRAGGSAWTLARRSRVPPRPSASGPEPPRGGCRRLRGPLNALRIVPPVALEAAFASGHGLMVALSCFVTSRNGFTLCGSFRFCRNPTSLGAMRVTSPS